MKFYLHILQTKALIRSTAKYLRLASFEDFTCFKGHVPLSELEVIREQHDLEVKNIQDEYEVKVQQLLMEIEKMQTMQLQQVRS